MNINQNDENEIYLIPRIRAFSRVPEIFNDIIDKKNPNQFKIKHTSNGTNSKKISLYKKTKNKPTLLKIV